MRRDHEYWMELALNEARQAMEVGEIPVASVLVSGNEEIGRGQTLVKRHESIAAHGELFLLLNAKDTIWTAARPLVLYSTLEPCLMCLGAAMQTGVDEIIFSMLASPDGGTRLVSDIERTGQSAPRILGNILESKSLALMRQFLVEHPDSRAIPYVKLLISPYESEVRTSGADS